MLFSGISDGQARVGVAVFLSEELSKCVRSWQCVSERIVVVKLKVEREWLTLVRVYAPTNDRRNETKEQFYNELQNVIEKVIGKRKTLLVIGDLNVIVGRDSKMWGSVTGRHGEEV